MRVLIVGDLDGQISAATKVAMQRGAKVACVGSVEQATSALRAGRGADLLLVDVRLDISRLIAANEAERIVVPVVACGVGADPRLAAAAIRAGARDYLPLPPDAELIGAMLAAFAGSEESALVAADPAMKTVLALAEQVAPSDASVLITGESGVGKEVLARYVHARSKRANGVFIAVNCAAIPDNLLESELFGHEKGAFTGAVARRIGKFQEAEGGTLLLDEISEMDLRLQPKLLRALQERVIDPIAGKPAPVDIRVIATSNRDLAEAVARGAFRQDLWYRLNVVNLAIPPLRDRPADIPALAAHFVAKYAAQNGRPAMRLTPEAVEAIARLPWRGNVRELENTMHRAVLLSPEDAIGPDAIRAPNGAAASAEEERLRRASDAAHAAARALVGRTVDSVEQDLILETLQHCAGNRTHAATILGISIRTLRNKLKLYMDAGVTVPPPPNGAAA